jgi:hypothetical protein
LLTKDVLFILRGEAYEPIGKDMRNDNELVLFYSPFDRECKIAVLSPEKDRVVSILGVDFHLPPGVLPVSTALTMKAKRKYRELMFGKMKETAKANEVAVTLLVRKANRIIDTHECGTVPVKLSNPIDTALKYLAHSLQTIARMTADQYGHNTIRYELQIPNIVGEVKKHHFKHQTLVARLKASSH